MSVARSPSLPPGYELVVVEPGTDSVAEACRRATAGAEEGTLVWDEERAGLECALLLRPERPLALSTQLVYVAAVSLASALADWLSPMIELRFRWPNEVQVGQAAGASLALHWAPEHESSCAWLVLGMRLAPALEALVDEEQAMEPQTASAEILAKFARHFLADINRWAEEGFGPIRKRWLNRAEGLGEALTLARAGETLSGTFEALDEDGRMVLRMHDNSERRISIAENLGKP